MAKHRHKKVSNARRLPKAAMIAAPVAVVATFAGVGGGLVGAKPSTPDRVATEGSLGSALDRGNLPASRSQSRTESAAEKKRKRAAALKAQKARQAKLARKEREATRRAIENAKLKLWTTEELNLWSDSEESAEQLGTIDAGEKVLVTGREADEREEIVLEGEAFWVTAGYLSKEKPTVPGLGGECENGTSVPSGVSSNVAAVHAAVCAAFPEITIYGTLRGGGGDHGIGKAVDIMVSGDRGWEVAEFVRAHYAELGVSYVIYAQNMWSVERSSEGWRAMEDRGSDTANHYDHVHVSVF